MSKNSRLLTKVILILLGIFIIGYILIVSIRMNMVKQPEGIYIRLQDAMILTQALDESFSDTYQSDTRYLQWQKELAADGESLLRYEQFLEMMEMLAQNNANTAGTIEEWQELYRRKYKEKHTFLKEDWYQCYDSLRMLPGMDGRVTITDVTVLGIGNEVTDGTGVVLEEGKLLAEEGIFVYDSDTFLTNKYQVIRVYCKNDRLLTVREVISRGMELQNLWIMEAEDEQWLQVFYKEYEIRLPFSKTEDIWREQIGDFIFADGTLQSVKVKTDKINGKLLSVRDGEIELEGMGKYPYKEEMKVYKLYGSLSEGGLKDLRIGYDYTDFVLEDGVVCAGLLTRDEAMENIRVVIKNTDFAGAYHEQVELTADTAFTVRYGEHDAMESQHYEAGERVTFDKGSDFFRGGRVYIEPEALTGRIQLLSIERAQGIPAYRGKMEIAETADGLVVVNEVLLEEYLYSVVPSEMPASYPLEALKAQAVCARTYAYRHMLQSGIAGFGAHVDDSAGYQVYNNISENAQTTKAVKETTGSLLYYGEELCGSYYYSTSCGFGTDTNIWKSDSKEDTSYLQAKRIGEATDDSGESMTDEEQFKAFIEQSHASDYESSEGWYRWNYEVEEIDAEQILTNIQKRYETNPKLVLTQTEDGFESKPVEKLGEIQDIYIAQRGMGGVADELIIEGSRNTYKIISEHNIRYVLRNGDSKVIRQDGSEIAVSSLLPSAYFTLTVDKDGEEIVGYHLTGGGYGHGVGMSQNGAKEMAKKGFGSEEILTFFYQSCEVKNVY